MENQIYIGDKKIYVRSYIVGYENPVLIIIPNVGWYHVGPNRMFTQIAQRNFHNNINTYVFDYLGEGESSCSIQDINLNNLLYAFNEVYKYVKSKHSSNIFCLGIGIGNIILNDLYSSLNIEGAIFYLPPINSISIPNILDEKHKSFFTIENSSQKNHFFWRNFVGPYHDCSYNPISKKLIIEFLDKLKNYNFEIPAKNTLIISDDNKNIRLSNPFTEFLISNEYKSNITPSDWGNNEW
ncbi:hypothetical protein GLV95_13350, partial [Staphylococcus agnetis]